MRKITQTIVGTTPPLDKNVLWLDTTNSNSPVEKVFLNGAWIPTSAAGGEYYTKDEVDENFMGKIDDPHVGNILVMDENGKAVDSLTKPANFLANATNEGENGQVLSLQSSGPAWVNAPQGTVIVDDIVQDSPNPVKNSAIKQYVDNADYAKKDGYYSQMTVGSAENLVGQTVDKDAYLIRPTATSDEVTNEVANGVASVLGMEGNSAVWNQLIKIPATSQTQTKNNITITDNIDGSYTVLTTNEGASSSTSFQVSTIGEKGAEITGHKIYIRGGSSSVMIRVYANDYETGNGLIFTVPESYSSWPRVHVTSGTIITTPITVYPQYIDLTLLGIDNLTTTAQVEAWLAKNVGLKPYYGYNAGSLLSAQTLGVKTYGQNLLNPITRQAKLIPYTWEENSNVYTIKNVPSANNLQITYTPDATGVAVTIYSYDSENPTPIPDSIKISDYGGSGVLYISSATADTYVCMKWDEQKDDDVVPYEDHTQDFDVRKVYGKVSGAGEYVQCYPNGMRSAGTAKDTLTASEAVSKIGSVDMGTLSGYDPVSAPLVGTIALRGIVAPPSSNDVVANIICQKYSSVSRNNLSSANNQISINLGGVLVLNDSGITSAMTLAQIQEYLSGVMLNYELATPITYTDLVYRDGGIDRPLSDVLMNIEVNNWSIEEQLLTPYDENGNPTSIPATIKTQYGMDAVEAIDTLQKTCYFADDVRANMQALLTCINTNCSETLGGIFSVSDTATDKVFAFTFTPNTESDVEPTNEGE